MKINYSVVILGIFFIVILLIKIIQNYKARKKLSQPKRREILSTKDVINILFNVGLLTAGIVSILLGVGFENLFESNLVFTQPIINFLAGVLFIWFALKNIFWGGKT
jgi:hypothetical protein